MRRAYRCPCDGESHRASGRPAGGRALAVVSELDLIESTTGDRSATCPWWAFRDPDVAAVLQAYDCIAGDEGSDELLRQWWGDEPEWWLVAGLNHYRRVRSHVRAESYRLADEERKKTKGRRASLPAGHEMELEIRG